MAFPFHHRKLLNQTIYDSPPYVDCDPICFDVYISPPPPPPPSTAYYAAHPLKKHVGLSLFLTIAISVLATVFFLLTFYTIYKLCSTCRNRRQRRRSSLTEQNHQPPSSDEFLDEDHGPAEIDHPIWYIRTVGLQPSVVSAITVVRFKKGDGLVDGTDCSVCLSEFRDDEMLRLLPKCNHAFHVPCIDTWLRSHTNCPMCRAGIVSSSSSSSAVSLPVQEAVVAENLGENRVGGGSESEEILGREDSVLRIEIGVGEDGVDDDSRDEGKIETISTRRSCSVDHRGQSNSVLDTMRMSEVRESSVSISGRLMRLVGSSSTGGPSNVKRSLSCSAKV